MQTLVAFTSVGVTGVGVVVAVTLLAASSKKSVVHTAVARCTELAGEAGVANWTLAHFDGCHFRDRGGWFGCRGQLHVMYSPLDLILVVLGSQEEAVDIVQHHGELLASDRPEGATVIVQNVPAVLSEWDGDGDVVGAGPQPPVVAKPFTVTLNYDVRAFYIFSGSVTSGHHIAQHEFQISTIRVQPVSQVLVWSLPVVHFIGRRGGPPVFRRGAGSEAPVFIADFRHHIIICSGEASIFWRGLELPPAVQVAYCPSWRWAVDRLVNGFNAPVAWPADRGHSKAEAR